MTRGLHVRVDAGAELSEPIVLFRKGISGRSYTHHVVEVGANAKATLVIDHRGLIRVAANIEFIVGDGASLRGGRGEQRRRRLRAALLLCRAGRT